MGSIDETRCALVRANLATAIDQAAGLKARAEAVKTPTGAATMEKLNDIAEHFDYPAHPGITRRGRSDAKFWLWNVQVDESSFGYTEKQLAIAATLAAAEFQVKMSFPFDSIKLSLCPFLAEANEQLVGYWEGRLLGLISFLATAAQAQGLKMEDNLVKYTSWGLRKQSSYPRTLQALADMRTFPSSLHLLA